MLRWNEEQLAAYHAVRQTRREAKAEAQQHVADRPRSKYRNKKTRVGALVFDSKLEAARYVDLKKLEEGGVISGLQCQVPFKIEVNDQLICKYIADFTYLNCDRKKIVEDAKGKRTDVYMLKKKMMRAILGIEIQEFKREPRHARKP